MLICRALSKLRDSKPVILFSSALPRSSFRFNGDPVGAEDVLLQYPFLLHSVSLRIFVYTFGLFDALPDSTISAVNLPLVLILSM